MIREWLSQDRKNCYKHTFCNPDAGREKGNVERKGGYFRSNPFVPIPWGEDLPEYNRRLFELSDPLLQKRHCKKGEVIQGLFTEDQACLLPLTGSSFDVGRYEWQEADGHGKSVLMENITMRGSPQC